MNAETMPNGVETVAVSPEITQAEIRETSPSLQAELAALAMQSNEYNSRLDTLAASKKDTATKLADVRQKLGLPPLDETPPSLQHIEDQMKQIKEEKEKIDERHRELMSEQEKEKLVEIETVRLLNEEIAELKKAFLALDQNTQSFIVLNGRIPEGTYLYLPPGINALDPEKFKILIERVLNDEPITKEEVKESKKIFEAIEEKAEESATENIDAAIAHLETGSESMLTETDRQVLREADELLIGYEGGSYTPESLLARVEEQNRNMEAVTPNPSAAKEAVSTYNPDIQAN